MATTLSINAHETAAPVGASIFELAEQVGVNVPTSCRKQGKCRECLVEVVEGMDRLTPRGPEENYLKEGFRLSCRARVIDGSGEIRCHTMRRAAMQVESAAINLPGSGREQPLDPAITREGDRVLLDGKEIARSTGPLHGLAMDLGTTTVVVRLINLATGETVATNSFENPQRFGGSDVMARIQFDTDNPGRLLQRTLLGYLTHAIEDFPVDPLTIYELVVAGNSTMRDLFFGLNVYSIGQKPYWSLTQSAYQEGRESSTALSRTAKELRLPMHPAARVYGLPIVSGHVGADAAACLLAIDIAHEYRLVALMDIGTNTELFMGNRKKLLAASCPAGPAFEGRAISCGMPGLDGAIAKIRIDDSGRVDTQVIGGGEPEGICGSGLIDLLSELRRTDHMNELGRFVDGESEFTVDAAHGITFHESDMNELAQAKGANVAGLQIISKNYGQAMADLDVFYLAGGFGRHLDIAAARRIGLIPDLPDEKIVQIGNAAIEGASIALLSVSRRRELEELVESIQHIELETDPDFFDHFVAGCQFRPLGTTEVLE
jgi:uncharacterized 2Fe-2S/4Fe-4S cluster protein (DUF4445 family)